MNTRKHVLATAAMTLMTALATGTVFGVASSGSYSANGQNDATNQSTYPSGQTIGSDQSAAAQGAVSSPAESSEPSSQTYGASESSDANASADSYSTSTTITPSSSTSSSEAVVVRTEPVVVAAPDEPRYVPETGNAEYGSKLTPANQPPLGAAAPPARFNDATGQ
jgi:hypothetical protein